MPYDWDGLRRGGQAGRPSWLFQFTLQGWGWLETPERREKVEPGCAFSVSIPSAHRYYSDAACGSWRFFWFIVQHPYFVERVMAQPEWHNRVGEFAGGSAMLMAALRRLFSGLTEKPVSDPYRVEAQLMSVVLELERWVFSSRYPTGKRDALIEAVRNREGSSISELARDFGMSRTHFSHHFRRTVGESPALFLRKRRIKAAETLLATSTLSVKEIAAETGFTSANQLCKVFRAHYQCSPGDYRRMASSSLVDAPE